MTGRLSWPGSTVNSKILEMGLFEMSDLQDEKSCKNEKKSAMPKSDRTPEHHHTGAQDRTFTSKSRECSRCRQSFVTTPKRRMLCSLCFDLATRNPHMWSTDPRLRHL